MKAPNDIAVKDKLSYEKKAYYPTDS